MASNRHLRIRVANAELAGSARLHQWDKAMPVPFLCECDGEDCQAHVRLTLAEYDAIQGMRLYATAPGHSLDHGALISERSGHALYAASVPAAAVAV